MFQPVMTYVNPDELGSFGKILGRDVFKRHQQHVLSLKCVEVLQQYFSLLSTQSLGVDGLKLVTDMDNLVQY